MCIYAAEAGELEALHFAHEATGQPLNTAVAYAAAAKDNLPCLAYMVERVRSHPPSQAEEAINSDVEPRISAFMALIAWSQHPALCHRSYDHA
jgi:hypothetical protein